MNASTQHEEDMREGAAPSARLLLDAFDRVQELVPVVVEGLDSEELSWRPDKEANSIGWLLWHLARVEDSHLADLHGSEQVWTQDGWADRFALPYDHSSIGFGQSSDEVGQFTVEDPSLLIRYHEAVHKKTHEIVSRLAGTDLKRVIDDSYDPPVTIGTRLLSVVNDTTQHIGQAAYVRGLVERRAQ